MPSALALSRGGRDGDGGEAPLLIVRPDLGLYALFDPIGGDGAAALLGDRLLASGWGRPSLLGPEALAAELERVFRDIEDELSRRIRADATLRGIGAAAVVLVVRGTEVVVAHLGDASAYCFRGPRLIARTLAHTLLQSFLDSGQLTPEQAGALGHGKVVVRAVGMGRGDVELRVWSLRPGDLPLLANDGLPASVIEDELRSEVRAPVREPSVLLEALLGRATAAGARGALRAVVVRIGAEA